MSGLKFGGFKMSLGPKPKGKSAPSLQPKPAAFVDLVDDNSPRKVEMKVTGFGDKGGIVVEGGIDVSEAKGELIIPCRNRITEPPKRKAGEATIETDVPHSESELQKWGEGLHARAVKELLRESAEGEADVHSTGMKVEEKGLTILQRAKRHRAEQGGQDAAEESLFDRSVAVEDFGAALLRGMGYKEDVHGKVTPVQHTKRPNGLGLGAKFVGVVPTSKESVSKK